ncbi:TetR/AcrR family transcriptional regulator [Ramlibacter ginsenosidimutans]|uniref:TetR/AcrR family transcriptional regulator n=1 Tax=Ramlibacter ginsenosidimutans TaxID=502333 RepID=A0A934TRL8_9BURK|nr:TetR/AcrR family transcriptional regulator [Ramlibacter ginsenosidimutans]
MRQHSPPEFPLPRVPFRPTEAPQPPSKGVRAATFRLLLDTAMDLIQQDGHIPSIAEVAVRSNVSRATAYRYFPSRSALITSVVDASLGAVRNAPPGTEEAGARERVHQVFKATFPRFQRYEPQLRAALQLALEQWALQRAGLLEEEPYRRGHRVAILAGALAPLKGQLAPAVRDRLHRALSVLYGIEAYTILKDMWDVSEKEIERTVLWMADALIEASVREGKKK